MIKRSIVFASNVLGEVLLMKQLLQPVFPLAYAIVTRFLSSVVFFLDKCVPKLGKTAEEERIQVLTLIINPI